MEKNCSPLIISPALSPIPAKVVDKVSRGVFVDFKEFLADNVLLLQRLQDLGQVGAILPSAQHFSNGSCLREVSDPLTWAACFWLLWLQELTTRRLESLPPMECWYFSWLRSMGEAAGSCTIDNCASTKQLALHSLGRTSTHHSWQLQSLDSQMSTLAVPALCVWQQITHMKCALASMEGCKSPIYPRASHSVQANRQPHRFTPY